MTASPRYLVSIHDVMPETLVAVLDLFERLERHGLLPVTLLVVPGRAWREDDIERLRALLDRGAELAGHGWVHEVDRVCGLRHRLHSQLISKNVAEHLALSPEGRIDLMQRCHRWFVDQGLPAPDLYVPPAWAMGPLPRSELQSLPFKQFETLAGVYTTRQRRFHRLPLLGFEVETAWQRWFVGSSNAINAWIGQRFDRPLRLGIHPQDLTLPLSGQLEQLISRGGEALSYRCLG
jgi:predicted deacetylase